MVEQGYTLLHHDWRIGHRDIDIVMSKDSTLVFVEVKTRRNEYFLQAEQAVDARKILSLTKAANAYVKRNHFHANIRFDIVSVIGTPETGHTIRHIQDAFYPPIT